MSFNLYSSIRDSIEQHVQKLWPDAGAVDFVLSESDMPEHGDCAANIALLLAKTLKKSPMQLAEQLADTLSGDSKLKTYVDRIEVAKPGFINIFFNTADLSHKLPEFLKSLQKKVSGKEKVVIEHTNVNPNKAMHIGHLRNAILGDTINTVLKRAGFTTEVQYYVDDTGVQVVDTYLGIKELKLDQLPGEKFDHFCWRVYAGITEAYETDPNLLTKRKLILHELEKGTTDTAHSVKALAVQILSEHLKTMSQFGIGYTLLVWESDILGFGFWKTAFELLKKSAVFLKETEGKNKGCWIIKSDDDSVADEYSPDKVIVKSDGTVTYTGKDVAYHLWKFNLLGKDFQYRTWDDAPQKEPLATTDQGGKKSAAYGRADYVYNVIDVRQAYPQAMVKIALDSLGHPKQADHLKHVSYGIVSLSESTAKALGVSTEAGKSVYSMSGRKGIGIKVDDLLTATEDRVSKKTYTVESKRSEEAISARKVAIGAIKYYMLRYNPQTDMVFDFDEALSLEGNTGPYIQYAHARMAGILEKSGAKKYPMPKSMTLSSEESQLVKKMYQWPQILERVALDLSVNALTTYAFELANSFNRFYEAQPVLKAEKTLREQRIALVASCKEVLADVLAVLGIEAPEKM